MSEKEPEGWRERISEGLWQYEQMFGVPYFMLAVYLPLLALMLLVHYRFLYPIGVIHLVTFALTRAEPEWPQIFCDLFSISGEIEP